MLEKNKTTSYEKVGGFVSHMSYKRKTRRKIMDEDLLTGYTDPVKEQKFLRLPDGKILTAIKDTHNCDGCVFVDASGKCSIKDDEKKRREILTHLPSCAHDHVIYRQILSSHELPKNPKIIDATTGSDFVIKPKIDDYIIYEIDLPSGKLQAIGLVAQGNDEQIVLSFVPGGDSRIYALDAVTVLTVIQKK